MHVRFVSHDATDKAYYVAGKARPDCANRIIGFVRTSSSRSKSDFDNLAAKIEEEGWRNAVYGDVITVEGKDKGKRQKEVDETEKEMQARKLLAVAFVPLIAVREEGLAIPEVGKEGEWFKENMESFKKSCNEGDEDARDMLRELQKREDLGKMVGGEGGIGSMLDGLNLEDKK